MSLGAADLATGSPVGLFTATLETRLVDVNPAFERLTGVSRETALGQPLRAFLTHASQVIYALKVETALLDRGRADEILLELQRDGGGLPVLLTLVSASDGGAVRHGALFPAPERRAYELELIAARRAADEARDARDLLLREVYHRVKNNLQTVDSLLLLQKRGLKDPDAVDALQAMRQRIFALGLVHHQLMGSSDLRSFDVGAFLRELASHLAAAARPDVRIEVEAPVLPIGLDVAIPLGLIVTELVTRALRHSFPATGGTVRVQLTPDSGEGATLRVIDDGQDGHDDAHAADVSLGLSIVRGLVGQLGGRIEPASAGTTAFEIRLPLPEPP